MARRTATDEDVDKDVDSDVDNLDFNNFKGIYYGDKTEKYLDPVTGCHFEYYDICKRLAALKQRRKILDKRLGLKTTSMVLSPAEEGTEMSQTREQAKRRKNEILVKDVKVVSGGDSQLQRARSKETLTKRLEAGHSQPGPDNQAKLVKVGQREERSLERKHATQAVNNVNGGAARKTFSRNFATEMVPKNSLETEAESTAQAVQRDPDSGNYLNMRMKQHAARNALLAVNEPVVAVKTQQQTQQHQHLNHSNSLEIKPTEKRGAQQALHALLQQQEQLSHKGRLNRSLEAGNVREIHQNQLNMLLDQASSQDHNSVDSLGRTTSITKVPLKQYLKGLTDSRSGAATKLSQQRPNKKTNLVGEILPTRTDQSSFMLLQGKHQQMAATQQAHQQQHQQQQLAQTMDHAFQRIGHGKHTSNQVLNKHQENVNKQLQNNFRKTPDQRRGQISLDTMTKVALDPALASIVSGGLVRRANIDISHDGADTLQSRQSQLGKNFKLLSNNNGIAINILQRNRINQQSTAGTNVSKESSLSRQSQQPASINIQLVAQAQGGVGGGAGIMQKQVSSSQEKDHGTKSNTTMKRTRNSHMVQLGGAGGGNFDRSAMVSLATQQQQNMTINDTMSLSKNVRGRNTALVNDLNPYSNKQNDMLTRSLENQSSSSVEKPSGHSLGLASSLEGPMSTGERKALSKAAVMSSRAAMFSKRGQSSSRVRTISIDPKDVAGQRSGAPRNGSHESGNNQVYMTNNRSAQQQGLVGVTLTKKRISSSVRKRIQISQGGATQQQQTMGMTNGHKSLLQGGSKVVPIQVMGESTQKKARRRTKFQLQMQK